MSNIKYFGFAKFSASIPVYAICQEKSIEEEVKMEVGKVLSQLKGLDIRVDERQKIKSAHGCWYCKKDNKEIVYMVLCSSNYPERHIYAAINQLRDHLQKLGEYETEPDSTLKLHAKSTLLDICEKYQNLKNVDKIGEVNDNIKIIRQSVTDSTRKMLDNSVQLEDLQRKSETLKQHANQFSESATELERMMYWRNCKLKIIIVLVIACLITLIVVPIAVKSSSTTSSTTSSTSS